jgi:hypothetical protein
VWFTANGVPLGLDTIDGVGLARLSWTPAASQLTNLYHNAPAGQWLGNVQAWYVPPDDSALLPGVGVGELWVGRWDPCREVRGSNPSPCSSVEDASGVSYRLSGRPMATVYRDRFGEGTLDRGASIVLSVPQPPEPPPNADCDVTAWGVFDSLSAIQYCRRTCSRLQYWALSQTGDLDVLTDPSSERGSCDWRLSRTIPPPRRLLRIGHDACTVRAAQLGISTWNHTANVAYEIPMLAVFEFRDPHLVRVSGEWRATLLTDAHIRYAKLRVNASVNCR